MLRFMCVILLKEASFLVLPVECKQKCFYGGNNVVFLISIVNNGVSLVMNIMWLLLTVISNDP